MLGELVPAQGLGGVGEKGENDSVHCFPHDVGQHTKTLLDITFARNNLAIFI